MSEIVLERLGESLVVRLGVPHRVLSWALCGGGLSTADAVVWCQIRNADLPVGIDPVALLTGRLATLGVPDAVGMLTSRSLAHTHTARAAVEGVTAEAVATVGLSNALRVGDPPGPMRPGTINLLVRVSVPLTEGALVEAMSLAVEARTAAVVAAGWPSRKTGEIATGTGTDCVVLACTVGPTPLPWCGKHTAAGSAIGQAALQAITDGVRTWVAGRSP